MHPPPTITTSAVVLKLNLLQFYGLRKFPLVPSKNTLILLTEGSCPILLSVSERKLMSKPSDLVQGTLDLLIMKILALEPLHGWAIGQRLKQVSGDVLQVSDGSLYPALHKLEQQGWIEAEWKPTENNRRAKFYALTRSGKRQLAKETESWARLAGAISSVIALPDEV
jgi:transcriptional regulator